MKAWLQRQWCVWRRRKLVIAAAVLSGGEAAVTMGFDLPGSNWIPVKLRGMAICLLVAAAFYMRWRASRGDRDA